MSVTEKRSRLCNFFQATVQCYPDYVTVQILRWKSWNATLIVLVWVRVSVCMRNIEVRNNTFQMFGTCWYSEGCVFTSSTYTENCLWWKCLINDWMIELDELFSSVSKLSEVIRPHADFCVTASGSGLLVFLSHSETEKLVRFCPSGQVAASTWQAFPSVQGVTVQHESALDIYPNTHTSDPVLCFRDQGSTSAASRSLCYAVAFSFHLPSWVGVSALLFDKRMRLYICVYGCWKLCCVWFVCVGQMACGSDPKWNRPSFVGDIMTYLEWFLEGLVALTPFPWFTQQSGTFQKQFLQFCWMRIWRWLCAQEAVPLKDTQASPWAPRLVPVNNDLAHARPMEQSKSLFLML